MSIFIARDFYGYWGKAKTKKGAILQLNLGRSKDRMAKGTEYQVYECEDPDAFVSDYGGISRKLGTKVTEL